MKRREFLKSCAVLSLGSGVPALWARAAAAQSGSARDSILVVLQLTGGNDGLNTVIPFRDESYRKARPKLAIPADQVLKIDDELGFHPSAQGLAELIEGGKLGIVQGVGYPDPNRSHFESMDIWHTCQRKGVPARATGWLGRYLDAASGKSSGDVAALHVGPEKQPLALAARNVSVPSLASPRRFQLEGGERRELQESIQALAGSGQPSTNELLGFLQTSTSSALSASERIGQALRNYDTPVAYPDNELAAKFKTIAQLIDAGIGTRVYYLELDGFDTHSQQAAAHAALLQQFSSSVRAFVEDISHHGHGDRVLVVAFSEFGRRVAENASQGTDHGAAAPMFLAGSRVRAGLVNRHPSLTDLDDGDVKFHTDFRQVYAALLESWLGWPSEPVLGGRFSPAEVLAG
jgi:uncharacterized protein (DUF1501 family)